MIIKLLNGKRQDLGKTMASLVGPIQAQSGCLSCRLLQTWPWQDGCAKENAGNRRAMTSTYRFMVHQSLRIRLRSNHGRESGGEPNVTKLRCCDLRREHALLFKEKPLQLFLKRGAGCPVGQCVVSGDALVL